MEFNILGPLDVRTPGQHPALRRAKERCLLVSLLIDPNKHQEIETLIDHAWGDGELPDLARRTCQSYLSRVGDVAEAAGCGARLETGGGWYLLRIDPDHIDWHRFRRLKGAAEAAVRGGDVEGAVTLLRDAERLWRGPALAGLSGRWIDGMRVSMEAEHHTATVKLMELELALGRHAEITGELQRLSAEHPTDAVVTGYQMTALYRSGRHAEALQLYRDYRARCAELGLAPAPGLSALQQRMLRYDRDLALNPARRRRNPPQQAGGPPSPGTPFVGRAAEILALIGDAEPDQPLVKIIEGMPGVGKTALAVHAADRLAERYPDGRLYLNFNTHVAGEAPLDATEALRTLLELAGAAPAAAPRSPRELGALWQRHIAGRRLILLLDDVPGADAVTGILPATGKCLTLITTRRNLPGIAGSSALSLDVLPENDAAALFREIVGDEKADDHAALIKAAHLCGCLPLAITVNAAKLRDTGLATVSRYVEEVMTLQSLPERIGSASPRLVSAFQLSYDGLTGDQQSLFCHLGMNPCPEFTAHSAAAVAGIPLPSAEAGLAVLAGRHLVERAAQRRYRFHDLVRSFAAFTAERDRSQPERRDAERRLLGYYAICLERADRMLYGHGARRALRAQHDVAVPELNSRTEALEWLESEYASILRAAEHAIGHNWQRQGADIVHALAEFMTASGRWAEAVRMHSLAMRVCGEAGDSRRCARAAIDAGVAARETGQYDLALELASEAQGVYRSLGDRNGEAAATDSIGIIYDKSGRSREAIVHYREAGEIYRKTGSKAGQAEVSLHIGAACLCLSRFPEAAERLRNSLRIFRALGNKRGEAKALLNIGVTQQRLGHYGRALRSYLRSLAIYRELGYRPSQALLALNIGSIYQVRGDYEAALTEYLGALRTCRESGNLRQQAGALRDIGEVFHLMGRYDESLGNYEKARSIAEQIGDSYVMLVTLRGIAATERALGRYPGSLQNYGRALRLARELGDRHEEGRVQAGIAESEFRTRGFYAARIHWQLALEIFAELGVPEQRSVQRRLDGLADSASLPCPTWPD